PEIFMEKYFTIFFFLFSSFLFSQENGSIIKEKKLNLKEYNQSFHLRIEKSGQIFDLWSDDTINFQSQLTSFYWTIKKNGEVKNYYKRIKKIDEQKTDAIYRLVKEYNFLNLKSEEELEDWKIGIFDESLYVVNYFYNGKLLRKQYSDIENQPNTENNKIIKDFFHSLYIILDWDKNRNTLIESLPPGEYYNNSMFKLIKTKK